MVAIVSLLLSFSSVFFGKVSAIRTVANYDYSARKGKKKGNNFVTISIERKMRKISRNFFFAGPDTWWFYFPLQCDDLIFPTQSPIDVTHSIAVSKTPHLVTSNFEVLPSDMTLYNDGTGLTINPIYKDGSEPAISKYLLLKLLVISWGIFFFIFFFFSIFFM